MNKYLTESGWKAMFQKHKFKDNGLQRALAAHAKAPEDKLDERKKALDLVMKLATTLHKSKESYANSEIAEYLANVIQAAAAGQEEIFKARQAAKVGGAEKRMLENMVIEAAQNVATNAKANASFFGRQVVAACKAFEVHAKNKIDSINGELAAGDILGPLVSAVTGGISEVLAKKVIDPIGKRLVQEIAKLAQGKIKARADAIGKGSGDLEKAVGALTLGATDMATAIEGVVTQTIIPQCDKVIAAVNSGRRMSDDLTAFIEPFIRQTTTNMDNMLEQQFGLPTPARSKETQLKIFKDMVKRFEEKAIIAETPSGEKMEWNIKGVPDRINRNAENRAHKAGQQRERDIDDAAARR